MIDPYDLLERAIELELDGVVITEHDVLWPPDELAELQEQSPGLRVLNGVEVSAREGHFLVYGLPNLDLVAPGIPLADLMAEVRRHAAAIVAAHPFRWGQPFETILAEHGPVFHGLELVSNNVPQVTRREVRKVLDKLKTMPATGSSDAHDLDTVGCYFTEFVDPIGSLPEFVAALQSGRFRPRHHPACHLASGPVE
jgi:predicted metal-dependent phosphoesterase TrpH